MPCSMRRLNLITKSGRAIFVAKYTAEPRQTPKVEVEIASLAKVPDVTSETDNQERIDGSTRWILRRFQGILFPVISKASFHEDYKNFAVEEFKRFSSIGGTRLGEHPSK